MIIDSNMYWLPEELLQILLLLNMFMSCIPSANGWYGKSLWYRRDRQKTDCSWEMQGYQNLNYVQGDYEIEVQLKDLAAAGADKALLKLPGCQEWMSLELCRIFNDKIHQHAVDSKGKLIPLCCSSAWRHKRKYSWTHPSWRTWNDCCSAQRPTMETNIWMMIHFPDSFAFSMIWVWPLISIKHARSGRI